jgi:tetratricopeptide (TPR) repeat protein
MSARRLSLAALAVIGLAACATPAGLERAERRPDLPDRAEVAGVPFYPQEVLHCGPAALAMALAWSGLGVTPAELTPAVYTPGRAGSLPPDMVAGARRYGRLAVPVENLGDLLAELAAGHPVLVLQNLGLDWWPQWHYAVAVGYDRDQGDLVLHSGLEARQRMALSTFERTWARADHWALVILPPARLPATADEAVTLRAAAALEQVGHADAAATAYQTILERWPGSLGALMGLGNARYALGDLSGAEAAFRSATTDHPREAASWNNLAQVLAERGEREPALEAARRAVELGGPLVETYRTTLEGIVRDRPTARALGA